MATLRITAKSAQKLSPKRAEFVRQYLVDLNATQAAIRAGYSPKGAEVAGFRLLRDVRVSAVVEAAMAERAVRTEITADRVLQEVASLAFLDIAGAFTADGTLLPLNEMAPNVRAAIAGLETNELFGPEGELVGTAKKIKLSDKIGALTLLMRHMGMLNDKLKVQGDAENPLTLLVKSIQGSAVKPIAKPVDYDEEDA